MRYRMLGNTGLEISEIGLGCEGFVGKDEHETEELLNLAQKKGINYLDLYTPDSDLRDRIGKMLKGRREEFFLQGHLCTIWRDGQYKRTRQIDEVREGFEDMLQRFLKRLEGSIRGPGHAVCQRTEGSGKDSPYRAEQPQSGGCHGSCKEQRDRGSYVQHQSLL